MVALKSQETLQPKPSVESAPSLERSPASRQSSVLQESSTSHGSAKPQQLTVWTQPPTSQRSSASQLSSKDDSTLIVYVFDTVILAIVLYLGMLHPARGGMPAQQDGVLFDFPDVFHAIIKSILMGCLFTFWLHIRQRYYDRLLIQKPKPEPDSDSPFLLAFLVILFAVVFFLVMAEVSSGVYRMMAESKTCVQSELCIPTTGTVYKPTTTTVYKPTQCYASKCSRPTYCCNVGKP